MIPDIIVLAGDLGVAEGVIDEISADSPLDCRLDHCFLLFRRKAVAGVIIVDEEDPVDPEDLLHLLLDIHDGVAEQEGVLDILRGDTETVTADPQKLQDRHPLSAFGDGIDSGNPAQVLVLVGIDPVQDGQGPVRAGMPQIKECVLLPHFKVSIIGHTGIAGIDLFQYAGRRFICSEFLHELVCLLLFGDSQNCRAAVAETSDRGGFLIDIEDPVQQGHGRRQSVTAFKSGCVQIIDVIDSAVFAINRAQGFRQGVRRELTGRGREMDRRGQELVDVDPIELPEFDEERGLRCPPAGTVVVHGSRGHPDLLGEPSLCDPRLPNQDSEICGNDGTDLLVGFSGPGRR